MAGEPDTALSLPEDKSAPVRDCQVLVCLRITWELVNMQNARYTPRILTQERSGGISTFCIFNKQQEGLWATL